MLIHPGTQERILKETTTGAGTSIREGSIQSDSLLVTVFAEDVVSGTLTVTVNTMTDNGKEIPIVSFPTISAPTTELLLKKSGVSMQRFKITATYTGVCSYEVYVRAIEGAGESNVKIVGPANLVTSQATISTTPTILLPLSLTDRNGLTIKNFSGGGTLYVSEDMAKLPADAWPIGPGEVWFLDIASGVVLYAVASAGSLDVRIAEAGG